MAGNAFTAGVKRGGLTTTTEIKILICYMIKSVRSPLSHKDIADALVSAELANFFEIPTVIAQLVSSGHIKDENGTFKLTKMGENMADLLETDLPLTAREAALNAVLSILSYNTKKSQHQCEITPAKNGFTLFCRMEEMGEEIFSFKLNLPDIATAEYAKKCFVENGADVYKLVLAGLTGEKALAEGFFK
ncbi:MAG: DUF4364 family protein [Oscillospiraceae bacterium]